MNILKAVLVAVGVIACLFLFGGPNVTADPAVVNKFRDGNELGFASLFTALILILGIALILIFFVVQLISNPKKTIFSILGIIAALLVYIIFLVMGTEDTNDTLQLRHPVAQSTIVSTTAGIWTSVVAIVAGFLAIISGFFSRLIK